MWEMWLGRNEECNIDLVKELLEEIPKAFIMIQKRRLFLTNRIRMYFVLFAIMLV